VRDQLAPVQIEQDWLHVAVVVPHVVWGELVVPLDLPVLRLDRQQAVGVEVVSLPDGAVEVG
jgi:hypothetical protein